VSDPVPAWNLLPSFTPGDPARAPVAVPHIPAGAYRAFLAKLLEGSEAPTSVLETAAASGGELLDRASRWVRTANELAASPDAASMKDAARRLLLESGALLKQRPTAYVLQQIAEPARARLAPDAAAAVWPRFQRLRDFMSPLEEAVARVRPPIEPERLAPLLVRLDELYDDALLQVVRAHHLAALPLEEAWALAPEFLERLYKDFARASIEDHILAEHEKDREAGKGTGLRELLPELVDALENA
jgi:hypothetical protein